MFKQRKRLQALLEERARMFPARTASHEELLHLKNVFTKSILQQASRLNATDAQTSEGTNELLAHPVFICGAKKSGTSLLLQLHDSQSQLLTLPGDSHYVNLFLKRRNPWKRDELIRHWLRRFVCPSGQEPFWFLGEEEHAYVKFANHLSFFLQTLPAFEATVAALFSSQPRYQKAQLWVEKTPENELHVQQLNTRYPQAKYIHILRNPFANAYSLKKTRQARSWPFSLRRSMYMLALSQRLAFQNQKEVGENRYLIISFEDLVERPKEQMQRICAFLHIAFEVPIIPTCGGRPTTANSAHQKDRVVGRVLKRKARDQSWREGLSGKEQQILHNLFSQPTILEKSGFTLYRLLKQRTT